MTESNESTREARIDEARALLTSLGFPSQQSNERSALVLLCLIGLRPDQPWSAADGETLWGIHALLQWLRDHYDKDYAENSRETIRRQTLHQFIDAGLVLYNPDDPHRPVNSSANCYQIAPDALELLRSYDSPEFNEHFESYLAAHRSMVELQVRTRGMAAVPVTLEGGIQIKLTAGGQNVLIKQIIEQFCARWTPGGQVLYIGDAGRDDPVFDEQALAALGVTLDKHGKLPDVIVYLPDRGWLVLIEAASTHGPVDEKRYRELWQLFGRSTAGLVLVSCFPSRAVMRKFLPDIAWETEAWCADHPDHMIHFNGERFLGPYERDR